MMIFEIEDHQDGTATVRERIVEPEGVMLVEHPTMPLRHAEAMVWELSVTAAGTSRLDTP